MTTASHSDKPEQFFTVVPSSPPRGPTEYGNACCERIRKLLGPVKRAGTKWRDALDPRQPGDDDDAETERG